MTIEEMIARKRELGFTNKSLSQASGVPVGTLQKLFAGATKAPRAATIEALTKVLERPGRGTYSIRKEVVGKTRGSYFVRETVSAYAAPEKPDIYRRSLGPYTLEDYYALPDDRRAELIDGNFYDMAAPGTRHQDVIGELYVRFRDCIQRSGAGCKVFLSPIDVQLDCDQYTMVQPDLVVLCDRDKFLSRVIYGAPDLVIEVLSETTRKLDLFLKLLKYRYGGVREYWIVDPVKEIVMVYRFTQDPFLDIFNRSDTVPIGISDGHCSIDLKDVFDNLWSAPED